MELSLRESFWELVEKNFRRSIKFSMSGYVGFGVVELLTYILFNFLRLHNLLAVSPAFIAGVAVEFVINEFWTTRGQGVHGGKLSGLIVRLLKFEVLNLLGTAIAVGTQYALFLWFGLQPLIGNIIGSAIAFPFNYVIQLKITWNIGLRD